MTPSTQPNSRLTLERPDIWRRGVALATTLTGYDYAPKLPLADGTIYACGGGHYQAPTPAEKIKECERLIKYWKDVAERQRNEGDKKYQKEIADRIKEFQDSIAEIRKTLSQPRVFVPEGAMEWLLHEVGHWLAATPEERALPNYGYGQLFPNDSSLGDDREWQAWGFEEIVLAPFGPSRLFAPPSQRDGVGFSKAAIPTLAFVHIENRMRTNKVDVTEWRSVLDDWVKWERESCI